MFVGHYSVSFAAKRAAPRLPLWLLFVAVQFVDVLWAIFVLLGIEKVRIVPGITAANPLDLYYMPYTHSLVGSLVWAAVAAVGYRLWAGEASSRRGPLLVGAAVLSHWFLDLLVHRPDLPLVGDALKVGFGLWNIPAAAFLLEVGLLVGGLLVYLGGTEGRSRAGRIGFWVFAVGMAAVQATVFVGAPPPSDVAAAVTALVSYGVLAGVAAWLETKRVAATPGVRRLG